MSFHRYSVEVREVIRCLVAGGRLLVIEEKPYPAPHQVVVVLAEEQVSISYNDFAYLLTNQIIQSVGPTRFADLPAEEYRISPQYRA